MKLYSTVRGFGQAEQSIEKSRFIAYVKPVDNKEDGDAFIAEIKKKHKDATHNVPAMVIGEKFQIQWASDDGEPQGTSGAPIVQMLVSEGIANVVVVVTRYFGGIKLGTGGLVRAYTGSAKLGIQAAGLCDVEEMAVLSYKVDYSTFHKMQNNGFSCSARMDNIIYTDAVTCRLICRPECVEALKEQISGMSVGKAVLVEETIQNEMVEK